MTNDLKTQMPEEIWAMKRYGVVYCAKNVIDNGTYTKYIRADLVEEMEEKNHD